MDNLLEMLSIDATEVRGCPDCGEGKMRVSQVGNELVWKCENCGCECLDGRSEMYNDQKIIERRKNLLSSREIRAIRKKHSLPRKELALLTGFGEKSIKRWETGTSLQNASADRFLRLIADDSRVVDRLREIEKQLDK